MVSQRPRAVIAEDHSEMRERIAALLAAEFDVVGTAADGTELVDVLDRLAAATGVSADVVVVDIFMPRKSGLEAIVEMRSRGSRVPTVCLTSTMESDMVQAAWDAGASGFVVKTSLVDDLIPAIRAALAGRRFVSAAISSRH